MRTIRIRRLPEKQRSKSRVARCCTAVEHKGSATSSRPEQPALHRHPAEAIPQWGLSSQVSGFGAPLGPAPGLKGASTTTHSAPRTLLGSYVAQSSLGKTLLFGLENSRLARDFSRFPGTRARGSPASVSDAKRTCQTANAKGQLGVWSFVHQRLAASVLMIRPESYNYSCTPGKSSGYRSYSRHRILDLRIKGGGVVGIFAHSAQGRGRMGRGGHHTRGVTTPSAPMHAGTGDAAKCRCRDQRPGAVSDIITCRICIIGAY